MNIRPARPEDLPSIAALLREADLPGEGVEEHLGAFFVAESEGGGIAGAISLESHPPVGLLRSLVVQRPHRGHGLATALCGRLIDHARGLGLREIYLLTIDADGYFSRRRFRTVERSEAPQSICETAEFSRLCPASAILMRRSLVP